jgi:hypothetical protein
MIKSIIINTSDVVRYSINNTGYNSNYIEIIKQNLIDNLWVSDDTHINIVNINRISDYMKIFTKLEKLLPLA